jgi:hypothetical protein
MYMFWLFWLFWLWMHSLCCLDGHRLELKASLAGAGVLGEVVQPCTQQHSVAVKTWHHDQQHQRLRRLPRSGNNLYL